MTTPKTIIKQRSGWQLVNVAELFDYKDLFWFLVWRDIKVRYAQTVLGVGWAVLHPLVTMIIFTVIFGKLAKVSSDGVPYPIFSYAALVPWTYFAAAANSATASLVSSASILTKVYFPRLIFPMTPVFAKLLDFVFASMMLAVLMLCYGIKPSGQIVVVPLLIVLMVLTATAIGLWMSALAVQFRDVKFATTYVIQILMYAAPVVWPVSLLNQYHEGWRLAYGLYPMAGVISGFRAAVLGSTPIPWDLIGIGFASALFLTITGMFYFRRMERHFADVA